MAALKSCFPALVSNMCCSIETGLLILNYQTHHNIGKGGELNLYVLV
jgi:hypothetical protein